MFKDQDNQQKADYSISNSEENNNKLGLTLTISTIIVVLVNSYFALVTGANKGIGGAALYGYLFGRSLVMPILVVLIALFWKYNRNPRSLLKVFFVTSLIILVSQFGNFWKVVNEAVNVESSHSNNGTPKLKAQNYSPELFITTNDYRPYLDESSQALLERESTSGITDVVFDGVNKKYYVLKRQYSNQEESISITNTLIVLSGSASSLKESLDELRGGAIESLKKSGFDIEEIPQVSKRPEDALYYIVVRQSDRQPVGNLILAWKDRHIYLITSGGFAYFDEQDMIQEFLAPKLHRILSFTPKF